jgi:hypothetical protein
VHWCGKLKMDVGHHRAYLARMSLPPDQPPPAKPKLTPEQRRARYTDRLTTIRLRMLIGRELEERGITTPAEIGEASACRRPKRSSCCAAISVALPRSHGHPR